MLRSKSLLNEIELLERLSEEESQQISGGTPMISLPLPQDCWIWVSQPKPDCPTPIEPVVTATPLCRECGSDERCCEPVPGSAGCCEVCGPRNGMCP